jgi:hypothetical protein
MPDKHRFQVVLSDGQTRDIIGDDATIHPSGALLISGVKETVPIMFAPGAWLLCESQIRRQDQEPAPEPKDRG